MSTVCLLLVFLLGAGCGGRQPATEEPPPDETVTEVADDEILPRPFTAAQIRDEWVLGFNLTMLRKTGGTEALQRWTVIAADRDAVEIEYVTLDAGGVPVGDTTARRSTWVELRDHATFPAASGTREDVTRNTSLGTLEGWLYTVRDEERNTVTEFFFAKELPGAPVQMRTTSDGEVVGELIQIDRNRPE
jgi:hypothetical protein